MNDLLLLIIAAVLISVVISRRRRRRELEDAAEGGDSSRMALSYHRIEGERLALRAGALLGLPRGSWEALTLEDVPQPRRRRLVLSIGYEPALVSLHKLELLVWTLAREVQERARAHAVVIEAFRREQVRAALAAGRGGGGPEGTATGGSSSSGGDGERAALALTVRTGSARLLLAPDGLGWSGEERVIAATEGDVLGSRTLSLGEVHAKLIATLDVSTAAD